MPFTRFERMLTKSDRSHRPLTTPSRVLALVLAWLVFGLSLVSASPEAHAFLHRAAEATADDCHHVHSEPVDSPEHGCAVVWFACGVELPASSYLPLPAVTVAPATTVERPALLLAPPRYLRQPERGPPVSVA
jgi:hypothetical protein